MKNRFSKPSNSLSAVQIAAVNALGESPDRLADAVPHRLIAGPMQLPRYKPPTWQAPIR